MRMGPRQGLGGRDTLGGRYSQRRSRSGFTRPPGVWPAEEGHRLGQLRHGKLSMPNVTAQCGSNSLVAQTRFITEQLDPFVSWQDAREMVKQWGGPFVIKGIMSVDDARRAVDVGATAIIVSNHGGRQLDGAAAPIEVLPKIAEEVGSDVEVILEGGIRRGVHVLKALEILRSELVRTMQLSGCTDVAELATGVALLNDAESTKHE